MFECRSCALRFIRAVAGDGLAVSNAARRPLILTPRLSNPPIRRRIATDATPSPENEDAFEHDEAPVKSSKKRTSLAVEPDVDSKALKIELRYLQDPLKLADHVHYLLRDEKLEKALGLLRLASKSMSCIVGWNHVINHLMQERRLSKAFEIYNEMKKRAQFPDSYTYTHLLRGLAIRTDHNEVVRKENAMKAVAIYGSMFSASSKVPPSLMHTNAALQVCALALDLDAMWSIVEKMPDRGPGSADTITYTIILNAIRGGAFGENETIGLEQLAARRQKAVNDGRRIWLDVVKRWRAGEVAVDEDLVVAMARLLLISKRLSDWDDVLNLVQQTMQIERQVAPLGSPERKTAHIPQDAREATGKGTPEEEDPEGYTEMPSARAFAVIPGPLASGEGDSRQTSPSAKRTAAWVKPGNLTLSILLEACTVLRVPRTATAYWDLLTSDPYNVAVDHGNFNSLISLYALNRASARVAHTLSVDMPRVGVKPRYSTFRIALRACARDQKNHNVLDHAWSIIRTMEAECADPDIHTLSQFISLALATDNGPKILDAIQRLDPLMHNLRSRLIYGSDAHTTMRQELRERQEGIVFLQTMVGAIDACHNRGFVPDEDRGDWATRRKDLTQFLQRVKRNVEGLGRRKEWLTYYGSQKTQEEGGDFVRAREQRRSKFSVDIEARPHRAALGKFRKRGQKSSSDVVDSFDPANPFGTRQFEDTGFASSPSELGEQISRSQAYR